MHEGETRVAVAELDGEMLFDARLVGDAGEREPGAGSVRRFKSRALVSGEHEALEATAVGKLEPASRAPGRERRGAAGEIPHAHAQSGIELEAQDRIGELRGDGRRAWRGRRALRVGVGRRRGERRARENPGTGGERKEAAAGRALPRRVPRVVATCGLT